MRAAAERGGRPWDRDGREGCGKLGGVGSTPARCSGERCFLSVSSPQSGMTFLLITWDSAARICSSMKGSSSSTTMSVLYLSANSRILSNGSDSRASQLENGLMAGKLAHIPVIPEVTMPTSVSPHSMRLMPRSKPSVADQAASASSRASTSWMAAPGNLGDDHARALPRAFIGRQGLELACFVPAPPRWRTSSAIDA